MYIKKGFRGQKKKWDEGTEGKKTERQVTMLLITRVVIFSRVHAVYAIFISRMSNVSDFERR